MKFSALHTLFNVNSLTLLCLLALSACSAVNRHHSEICKTRAYLDTNVTDYVSTRFHSNAPVRLAIIPFSVPENVATQSDLFPGLGKELAYKIQQNFLASGTIPIVELLNREGWPGQKAEFYAGNFEAINMARNAGYDLVLVGDLSRRHGMDSLTAAVKIIETDSGITIWYGENETYTEESASGAVYRALGLEEKIPSLSRFPDIVDTLAACTTQAILNADRP